MNRIPRKFNTMYCTMLDNYPGYFSPGDKISVSKNDFGYITFNITQHKFFYVAKSILQDAAITQIDNIIMEG